jgi:hypothetical protein
LLKFAPDYDNKYYQTFSASLYRQFGTPSPEAQGFF